MGERKVLNKYYPPDFDPADVPRGKREKDNAMKVRMMLPMTVRCSTCGEFMYKGTKFNCKKEDVSGKTYLGLQIFRFYMRCRKCSAEITYTTNPQTMDYDVEHGASRNYEQWKAEQTIEEAVKSKRVDEDEDRVKKLENKTADSKREMDVMEQLDDLIHIQGQHQTITTEAAIAALQARRDDARAPSSSSVAAERAGDLAPEDQAMLRRLVEGGAFVQRVSDDEDEGAPKRVPNLVAARPAVKKRAAVKVKAVKRGAPQAAAPEEQQPPKKHHADCPSGGAAGTALGADGGAAQGLGAVAAPAAAAPTMASLLGNYDTSSADDGSDGAGA